MTRQRTAEKVAELFGTRAVCNGGYYRVWYRQIRKERNGSSCMMGASIRNAGSVDAWFLPEENTAPRWSVRNFPIEKWENCRKWCGVSGHHGAKVNTSCGQHVHVDASNHTPRSLKKCHDHYVFQRGHPV